MTNAERIGRDRAIHTAVLAGDDRAWRIWYDEAFDALHAYVAWRSGGLRDLTEEVVQETWLTAVRRIGSFDPGQGPLLAWLRGIAAKVLQNHFRKHLRRPPGIGLFAAQARLPVGNGTSQGPDPAERVARALARLPDRYEAVLRAKYVDGMAVSAIALEWNDSPKAIESLLTRARSAFREAYLQPE